MELSQGTPLASRLPKCTPVRFSPSACLQARPANLVRSCSAICTASSLVEVPKFLNTHLPVRMEWCVTIRCTALVIYLWPFLYSLLSFLLTPIQLLTLDILNHGSLSSPVCPIKQAEHIPTNRPPSHPHYPPPHPTTSQSVFSQILHDLLLLPPDQSQPSHLRRDRLPVHHRATHPPIHPSPNTTHPQLNLLLSQHGPHRPARQLRGLGLGRPPS
jgi:hypothetical protein